MGEYPPGCPQMIVYYAWLDRTLVQYMSCTFAHACIQSGFGSYPRVPLGVEEKYNVTFFTV